MAEEGIATPEPSADPIAYMLLAVVVAALVHLIHKANKANGDTSKVCLPNQTRALLRVACSAWHAPTRRRRPPPPRSRAWAGSRRTPDAASARVPRGWSPVVFPLSRPRASSRRVGAPAPPRRPRFALRARRFAVGMLPAVVVRRGSGRATFFLLMLRSASSTCTCTG